MRLIDSDELKNDLNDKAQNGEFLEHCDYMLAIDSAPTIEAEPVRHGKWFKTFNVRCFNTGETHYIYTCSICDFYTGDQGRLFNYCPKCGAEMDGGDEGESNS